MKKKIFLLMLLSSFYAVCFGQQKINGIVTSSTDGLGIPGVNVVVKGTAVGASTDIDGKYSLVVPEGGKILVFSSIGMKQVEKPITGNIINVVMKEDLQMIDEVVVTGYQKIDKKMFTGSASVVKSDDAKIDGISDVSRMLQGKAAGVSVTDVSGTFGAAPKIRVRGASSINGNQNPLWVVDGVVLEDVVEVSADDLSSGNAETLISSAVSGINSDDIETFQILKDASATALYGARAMNGVIVITTKGGRAGRAKINYTGETTIRLRPYYSDYNVLNSVDQMSVYKEMQQKGFLNYSSVSRSPNGGEFFRMYELITDWDKSKQQFGLPNTVEAKSAFLRESALNNTNWFKELFKPTIQQSHAISISGGTEKSSFYSSFSYFTDPGWTDADKVDRFTANAKGTYNFNKNLSVTVGTTASMRKQTVPGTINSKQNAVVGKVSRDFDINPFSYALNTSRTMKPYDKNGNLLYYQRNYAPFNIINEMHNNNIDLDMMDMKFQGEINYKPIKGLDISAVGSVRYVKSSQEHRITEFSNYAMAYRAAGDGTIRDRNKYLYKDPENLFSYPMVVLPEGGFYNTADDRMLNYYFRTTANYNRIFNSEDAFNVLIGQEIKYTDRLNRNSTGFGYQYGKGGVPYVDYRIIKQMLEGGFDYYGMQEDYDRFAAFFATTSFSHKSIYTLNLTGRYDGSNRLGKAKNSRWLPTWNVSGQWNVKEHLLKDNDNISILKLRATYGLTASMGPAKNSMAIFYNDKTFRPKNSDNETLTYISSLENSELTWEKQNEFNLGVDVGILENRISLSLDAYLRKGFDLIGVIKTSGIGGEFYKLGNYADMESKGVEFSLNTVNINSDNFQWNTNLTFSHNTNEITNLKSEPNVWDLVRSEGGAVEGFPVRGLFSIPFVGLTKEGLPEFISNKEGEKTISGIYFQEKEDITSWLKYEGPIDPKFTGGLENTFKYKNWSMGLYITYQFGNVIRLNPDFSAYYSDQSTMPEEMKNRWVTAGDENHTTVPVIASKRQLADIDDLEIAYNSYNYSSVRVAKGDFIRLKAINLSYNLPKEWASHIGMNSMQLRLVASNLWLMYSDSKLNGQDPEFARAGGVSMPIPKQFTFSLRAEF